MTVKVEKFEKDLNIIEGVENMIKAMIEDYNEWSNNDRMKEEFANSISFSEGRKYIKVVRRNGGVLAFIVNTTKDKLFELGDILMPASYYAPTRNAPRGNVLFGDYAINWTGPVYLK